jgi:hypothetical protein
MKPEDLKVGMVFEDEQNYYKIFNLNISNIVYYYYFEIKQIKYDSPLVLCGHAKKNDFIKCNKLIDKVPHKIVEVEEEIPLYVEECFEKNLHEEIFNDPNILDASIMLHLSTSKEKFCRPLELCKIKRTVKKELNWCWEEGIWK